MTDIDALIMRAEFELRATTTAAYLAYVRQNNLDPLEIGNFAGTTAILEVVEYAPGRFAFEAQGEKRQAFVCEVFAEDGETTIDLCAWPIDAPAHVMTYRKHADILGAWEASNHATYTSGKALEMHRTPLDWLKAGCAGAVVINPELAKWRLLNIPLMAGQDQAHGRELFKLMQSVADPSCVTVKAKTHNLQVAA